jgi:homoserine O-acetyltransferase
VALHLGLEKLHTTIGCSMGGMSALAFCVRHPEFSDGLISISSATRALPFSIAVRSLQREMIRQDQKWLGGNYDPADPPITGQRLARKLGMITYRSAKEWEQRFGRERMSSEGHDGDPFHGDFAIESYLEMHGNKFTGQFDPNCYLYLSRASDLFDFAEHGGSLQAGFGKLKLERALVIGVETDILFPLPQQKQLADGLAEVAKEVRFVPLACSRGHDSFLGDLDAFRPVVCSYFETCGGLCGSRPAAATRAAATDRLPYRSGKPRNAGAHRSRVRLHPPCRATRPDRRWRRRQHRFHPGDNTL